MTCLSKECVAFRVRVLITHSEQVLIPPEQRQWSHSPGVFLEHPPEQTDAFVLYVKSSLLVSKVKLFNLRFRAKCYAGDPKMSLNQTVSPIGQLPEDIDPRQTEGFKEIDVLVHSFVDSFPRDFKDPVKDGVVDAHLLVACISPNVYVPLLPPLLAINAYTAVKYYCTICLPIYNTRVANQSGSSWMQPAPF